MFREKILPYIILGFYRLVFSTWRVQLIEAPGVIKAREQKIPITFAHWHGDELAMIWLLNYFNCCVMTSTSKDGQLMDSVLRLMGIETSRGSSTRGGVSALKGILRIHKRGHNVSIAVDGPKGPYHKPKPGIFEVSKLTKTQIVPAAAACSHAFVFKRSWNKAYLPLPFTRIVLIFAEPLPAVTQDQDVRSPDLALSLEQAILAAGQEAQQRISRCGTP